MGLSLAEKFTFLILLVLIAIVEVLPAPGTADFRLIRTLVIFGPLFFLLLYPFGVLRKTDAVLRREVGSAVGKEKWMFIHNIMKLEKRGVLAFAVFFLTFIVRTLSTAGAGEEIVFSLPRPVDIILSIVMLGAAISFILVEVALAHETHKFREFSFGSAEEEEEEGPWGQFLTKTNTDW